MAALTYLDTHVLVWLYLPRIELLSRRARSLIEAGDLLVSPMAVLELELLHEIGRLRVGAWDVLEGLQRQLVLQVCDLSFPEVALEASRQRWTRDPFDRIIVAQAALRERVLVTRDESMRQHYEHAKW